jgi:hypothetical protein
MDIISHGLWASGVGRLAEKKIGRKINGYFAFFWGMFPDLFAFTIPVIWFLAELFSGNIALHKIPRPQDGEPPGGFSEMRIFNLASSLYNVSHSLFIFLGSFLLAYWILKRIPWEIFGWLLHILIDILTHPYNFFPTPIFWPVSGWKFQSGFTWAQPWFMTINILALGAIYFYLFKKGKFKKRLDLKTSIEVR